MAERAVSLKLLIQDVERSREKLREFGTEGELALQKLGDLYT